MALEAVRTILERLTLDQLLQTKSILEHEIGDRDPCRKCKEECTAWCTKKKVWYKAFKEYWRI